MGAAKYLGLVGTKLQVAIGVVAGFDFLLFGYDQGVTGGLLNLPSFYQTFPEINASADSPEYKSLSSAAKNHRTTIQGTYTNAQARKLLAFILCLSVSQRRVCSRLIVPKIGISVATYNLGCFSGAITTIWIGNLLGRRRAILLGSSIMVIGAILQCTSFSLAQLIIGRWVTGVGESAID